MPRVTMRIPRRAGANGRKDETTGRGDARALPRGRRRRFRSCGRRTVVNYTDKSAILSDCGVYRYTLTRRWGTGGSALFICLNPSTADADCDDPTIRRIVGFAKDCGQGAVCVVNLYAFRATDPKALRSGVAIVGPENDRHIMREAEAASIVVAAWGASLPDSTRHGHVLNMIATRRGVLRLGQTTASGQPRHPLYLSKTTVLETHRLATAPASPAKLASGSLTGTPSTARTAASRTRNRATPSYSPVLRATGRRSSLSLRRATTSTRAGCRGYRGVAMSW